MSGGIRSLLIECNGIRPHLFFDPVWQDPTLERLDAEAAFKGRHGPLVTVGSFADAATDPDGFEGGGIGYIQTVRIDQIARMADLASQTNGVASDWRSKGPTGL